MKVVILAGGFGTRPSEESVTIPKPLVDSGKAPWKIWDRPADLPVAAARFATIC